ncbi:uncharacterized protein LOC116166386 [Photinus pyralis]|uniref:uncharacterized protein LOC116166386 n=1 Tax=Photinus pyralis TaxID=7054 RepID=UPI00126766D2|nr:uncharacterized protein LOC116166386 [Photinus pyralis]
MNFFEEVGNDKQSDSSSTAAALGFFNKMESFGFYFNLHLLISVFEGVERLNAELQKKELSVNESHRKVYIVKESFSSLREKGFSELWHDAESGAAKLRLQSPTLPRLRLRKVPRRLDSGSSHEYSTPRKYFEKLFYEVIDLTLTSLNDRFQSDTINFLNAVEDFILKKLGMSENVVTSFYNINGEEEFDPERLRLHRDMLLDAMQSAGISSPNCIMDVVQFLRANPEVASLIPEIKKLCRIILTIPASTCTAERSFSALHRLNTYLRSNLRQDRLNHVAVLHVHRDYTAALDLKPLMKEWISRSAQHSSTFSMAM